MDFSCILALLTLLYLCQVGFFLVGLLRIKDNKTSEVHPFVSIVIAARNEEEHLQSCLQSILHQTYPQHLYEVIVVNDNSTDATESVCRDFATRFSHITTFISQHDDRLQGKANALAQGIDRSKGEIILITDADCVVPETWVEHTALRYQPATGLVGGMTLQIAENSFQGMQSLDWAYLLGVAASTTAIGIPLTSIGNNFSFRKSAYDAVGGYRALPMSITEDYVLFQSIVSLGTWKYLYPVDPHLLVMSQPCKSWRGIIQQKHRWGKGGVDMKLSGLIILLVGFTLHVALLVGLCTGNVVASMVSLLMKSVFDFYFLYRVLTRLQCTSLLKYFPAFEVYFLCYVTLLPFLVFFGGKVIWKGRTY